jgi:hypothetical protein
MQVISQYLKKVNSSGSPLIRSSSSSLLLSCSCLSYLRQFEHNEMDYIGIVTIVTYVLIWDFLVKVLPLKLESSLLVGFWMHAN